MSRRVKHINTGLLGNASNRVSNNAAGRDTSPNLEPKSARLVNHANQDSSIVRNQKKSLLYSNESNMTAGTGKTRTIRSTTRNAMKNGSQSQTRAQGANATNFNSQS